MKLKQAIAALALAAASIAHASYTYSYHLTFSDLTPYTQGDLYLYTNALADSNGVAIMDVRGTIDGYTVIGIDPGNFDGANNLLYSSPMIFDANGLSVDIMGANVSGSTKFNLWNKAGSVFDTLDGADSSDKGKEQVFIKQASLLLDSQIPEPSSLSLMGLAILGLSIVRRRKFG